MLDLSGMTALVTGSARGVGFGIAEVLVRCGARVAVNDLHLAEAEAAAEKLGNSVGLAGDVSNEASCVDLIQSATEQLGSIDILVNNAGLSGPLAPLSRQDVDDWQQVMNVNLRGAYLMSRAVAAQMISRRTGVIINIASIAGLTGFPASHAYGVSKAGVVMLTKTLGTELARWNVRVNCIAPGIVDAPMLDAICKDGASRMAMIQRVPLGRLGTPADIGHTVAFLASPLASYINGAVLPVDGGWLAFGGAGAAWKETGTGGMTPCS
jgi:3-oxoacyl-[acyl-carrier protein] reductase